MRTSCRVAGFGISLILGVSLSNCRTPGESQDSSSTLDSQGQDPLKDYEVTRIKGLAAAKQCESYQSETGIFVTKRDAQGNALEGKIRVLSDNPNNKIEILADFNGWGESKTPEDKLKRVDGTPYYEGKIRKLSHKMQYRLLVNGEQLLDPSANQFTTESFFQENGLPSNPAYLNSVFWDFGHPGAYKMQTLSVDLRQKPLVIAETEVLELVKKFKDGPKKLHDTYKFVAESGVITELKNAGYNAVEFLPFNTSVDGDRWHFRYQVFGLFAPESRYGSPDEFAQMLDAFNKAGIAIIMDAVVGHYPHYANEGIRHLDKIGIHRWKKPDGKRLFGEIGSPWGTFRYDYANPFVRRFLVDSTMTMICRYGISGIRFDNLDGIRLYEGPGGGGPEFLKQLMSELRAYRPESILIAEMFFGFNEVLKRIDKGGFGVSYRTHSDFFDFLKDNMLKQTQEIDLQRLKGAIRNPFDYGEASRVQYVTNHDEAANRRDGATGAYVASLVNGGGWYYVENKTKAFGSLAMLTSSVYLDMPQMRLLQEGSFNENSAVDWGLRKLDSQRMIYDYFAALSNIYKDNAAFAFQNFRPDVENHVDSGNGNRIISVKRKDLATGKTFYALINLGHVGIANYRFGVETQGTMKVAINSDAKIYAGSGELEKRAPSGVVTVEDQSLHGKPRSVSVPFLAPYATVLLESL